MAAVQPEPWLRALITNNNLRKEHRLSVFDYRVMRKILNIRGQEVHDNWKSI
jgi:hypothetical protein